MFAANDCRQQAVEERHCGTRHAERPPATLQQLAAAQAKGRPIDILHETQTSTYAPFERNVEGARLYKKYDEKLRKNGGSTFCRSGIYPPSSLLLLLPCAANMLA